MAEIKESPISGNSVNKSVLFRQFRMRLHAVSGLTLAYQTVFQGNSFGVTSMIVNREMREVVGNEFYHFGRPWEEGFREDLLGLGLGTLAHTLVLQDIVATIEDPSSWELGNFSATGNHCSSVKRMGNGLALSGYIQLTSYLENARQACRAIGFPLES